mgnify:CR=1 FL=1
MTAKVRMWITDNRVEVERFLKFAVVGTIGAVVDFGTLYLLHVGLNWPLALANTVSFTCAVLSNFTWNRLWTYPDSRSKPIVAQLVQFFVVNIAGWAINTGILLALSGVASIVGSAWIAARSAALALGSIVGGVLFLIALIPMTRVWLREA